MSLPAAHISHRTLPRTRFKVPARRGDAAYFERVQAELAQAPGVIELHVNPLTASVLVIHDSDVDALARYAEEKQLFHLESRPQATSFMARLSDNFQLVNERVRKLSGGELDLPTVAFLNLVGMAVAQLRRGNITAPATTLLWYAVSLALLVMQTQRGDKQQTAL